MLSADPSLQVDSRPVIFIRCMLYVPLLRKAEDKNIEQCGLHCANMVYLLLQLVIR